MVRATAGGKRSGLHAGLGGPAPVVSLRVHEPAKPAQQVDADSPDTADIGHIFELVEKGEAIALEEDGYAEGAEVAQVHLAWRFSAQRVAG